MTEPDILTTEELLEGIEDFLYRWIEVKIGIDEDVEFEILRIVLHLSSLTHYALAEIKGKLYTLEQQGVDALDPIWACIDPGNTIPDGCEMVWKAGESEA